MFSLFLYLQLVLSKKKTKCTTLMIMIILDYNHLYKPSPAQSSPPVVSSVQRPVKSGPAAVSISWSGEVRGERERETELSLSVISLIGIKDGPGH